MANEILKDERLTDEQLDGVAGGYRWEVNEDYSLMKFISQRGDIRFNTNANFFTELKRAWSLFGITVNYHDDDKDPNEYYTDDGTMMSHKEAVDYVLRAVGFPVDKLKNRKN